MNTRGTPSRRRTSAWLAVATVMPHAPASSCRSIRVGAIAVLACGAKSMSCRAQYAAMVSMLACAARCRSTITGQVKPPSNRPGRDAARSAPVSEPSGSQKPLVRQSARSAGMSMITVASTLAPSRTLCKLPSRTNIQRLPEVPEPYDLLFTGGDVLDPGGGHAGRLDVAVAAGRIAAVGADLPAGAARRVDVTGRLLTPGLVDLHTHVFPGGGYWGIDPDPIAWYTDVTTWVDAGSAGAYTIDGLRAFAAGRQVRVPVLLNIAAPGL